MIVVRLYGGLGNQMFQYAAARRLSLCRQVPLALDLSWFDQPKDEGITPREFELESCFRIAGVQRFVPGRAWIGTRKDRKARLRAFVARKPYFVLIAEKGLEFDEEVLVAPPNSILDGYWGSEKYFEDVEKEIREEYQLKHPLDNRNVALLRAILDSESVSIHVRRSDYVTNPAANQLHGTPGTEYYDRAIASIHSQVDRPTFFIFSDDIEWCRKHLSVPQDSVFVAHNTGNQSYKDMWLMSQCRHNIVANSTFSWWAAWLNVHQDPLVIAPRKWFNNGSLDTRDLIPTRWVQL